MINLDYFDFNFHIDYSLFSTKKFQLFVSPAFKYEFQTGYSLSSRKWNFLVLKQPSSIIGGSLSTIFKYKVSKHFGLTLTPEYTVFAHPFATGNDKSYQRFNANFGMEFCFGE
jgi:hypothetical protein